MNEFDKKFPEYFASLPYFYEAITEEIASGGANLVITETNSNKIVSQNSNNETIENYSITGDTIFPDISIKPK